MFFNLLVLELIIAGHSMGAGVAALLALVSAMTYNKRTRLMCFSLGRIQRHASLSAQAVCLSVGGSPHTVSLHRAFSQLIR